MGKLTQYLPQNGIYVYFRHNEQQTVMVIMSQNADTQTLDMKRFAENLVGFNKGKNILNDSMVSDLSKISVPSMSIQVIEWMK